MDADRGKHPLQIIPEPELFLAQGMEKGLPVPGVQGGHFQGIFPVGIIGQQRPVQFPVPLGRFLLDPIALLVGLVKVVVAYRGKFL